MGGFDADLLEVLILHHNITTALEFEALYDLVADFESASATFCI
jgi:hypothetical protein